MNVSIRNVNPELFRRFKAEAIAKGLNTGTAVEQALNCWLETKSADPKKKKSFFDLKPKDWGPGTENASEEIDEVLYGGKL